MTAEAWITGEAPNQKIHFRLPSGNKGPQGIQGLKGDKGEVGPTGPPVALEIGTVTASAGNPADDDIMSTLILSGTKTQAAIKAQIPIEMIGEQGPKGDPGGFSSTSLGGSHLDTIVVPGWYHQSDGALITSANGYPITRQAQGRLSVQASQTDNTRLEQEFSLVISLSAVSSRVFYRRTLYSGTWSAWRAFTSTRVDNTAGKAIYQWDPTTDQEQMIYGDTGRRDVTSLCPDVSEGKVYVRRIDSQVVLELEGVLFTGGSTTSTHSFSALPYGMRPATAQRFGLATASMNIFGLATMYPGSNAFTIRPGQGAQTYNSISWATNDPWPTVLPGTPV